MSLVSVQNFATVFSQVLPEGSSYVKSKQEFLQLNNRPISVNREIGYFPSRDEVIQFALKVFDFKENENITFQKQVPDLLGRATEFCVSSSGICGTIDQRGTVGLKSTSQDFTLTSGSSLTVELLNRKLNCDTAGETVVCSATIDGKSVIDQPFLDLDRPWTSYALGAVAFCVGAYYGGKIIVKNAKTMYESGKTLVDCHKVVALKVAQKFQEKINESSKPEKDGSQLILFPILKDIWAKRNELKTSKGEPLGKAYYRAEVDLTKAGAKIAAVSALAFVAGVTAYFGV